MALLKALCWALIFIIRIHLKSIYARHGIPEELISDNMPFNSKEFHEFAK